MVKKGTFCLEISIAFWLKKSHFWCPYFKVCTYITYFYKCYGHVLTVVNYIIILYNNHIHKTQTLNHVRLLREYVSCFNQTCKWFINRYVIPWLVEASLNKDCWTIKSATLNVFAFILLMILLLIHVTSSGARERIVLHQNLQNILSCASKIWLMWVTTLH